MRPIHGFILYIQSNAFLCGNSLHIRCKLLRKTWSITTNTICNVTMSHYERKHFA